MRRTLAVLSIVMLASAVPRRSREQVAVGTRASASAMAGVATDDRPDELGSPAEQGARASRAAKLRGGRIDVAMIEKRLAARMPRHDGAFHRRLAAAIHHEARHARVDPLLVLALIHVESSFDPDAVSPAGAVGLMQLREPTMRREIERAGVAPADPLDPVTNVRAGIRYLERLVKAFGNTDVALMAYNAGPNRILSYRRAGGIPERFHVYPQRVRGELERLRTWSAGTRTVERS
jgi:soluble lytic murein transglycosylase-like protein